MTAKASLVALAAAVFALGWYGRPSPPVAAEPPLLVSSAHTHANLTVFLVRGPDVLESRNILTLQEALEKGLAVVHETDTVNTLAVENLSADHELFLQSGDIVKGGKQDRIIADDMLVGAKSGKVPCRANCCEQSRWQPRAGEVATKFEKSTDFAVGNDIKIANASGQQGEVWKNVEQAQKALSQNLGKPVTANASPTSLQLALEDKDLRAKVADFERSLAGLANAYPDAVGVVMAVNGQVIASDVYGSKELFRKAWPKLLKSAAVDAVAQMPTGATPLAERTEAVAFLTNRTSDSSSDSDRDVYLSNVDRSIDGNWYRSRTFDAPSHLTNSSITGAVDITENEQVALASLSEALRTRLIGSRSNPSGQPAPQPQGFSGRTGATRSVTVNTNGGNRNDSMNESFYLQSLNSASTQQRAGTVQSDGLMQTTIRQATAPSVVSFESRAGSQGNALIHRGQLKK
jgi:hypothetical protein